MLKEAILKKFRNIHRKALVWRTCVSEHIFEEHL